MRIQAAAIFLAAAAGRAVGSEGSGESPGRNQSSIRREISSIYHLESLSPLISDEWARSRRNEKAVNALLLREAVFPIAFIPRLQRPQASAER